MQKDAVIVAGILEDNKDELLLLENMIYEISQECGINVEIAFTSRTCEAFMDNMNEHDVNTCLLDIELNGSTITGMNIAEQIDNMGKGIKTIFVTGYNGYMNTAFKVSAFDYLMKPLNKEDLRKTLVRLKTKLSSSPNCIEIYTQEYIRVPYNDIIYIQYIDRRVKVFTVDSVETLPSSFNLKSVISRLPADQFIECNAYTCVNMNYVKKFSGSEIELNTHGAPLIKNEYGQLTNKMYLSRSGTKRVKDFIKSIVRM